MRCASRVGTLILPLVVTLVAPRAAPEPETVDEISTQTARPSVKVESVTDLNDPRLTEGYRFMMADFVKAGGRGRTFYVRTEYKPAAGPYLAVDRLPPSVVPTGASLFTRDPQILAALEKIKRDGTPLLLQSTEKQIDAQVFVDDELGRPLRNKAFPQSKKTFVLSVSPSMTFIRFGVSS